MTERSPDVDRERVRGHLTAFAADFNARRLERMALHYTRDFSAVVDGEFVSREAYLSAIAALVDAGYAEIAFDLHTVQALSPAMTLADGTTTIRAPDGQRLLSRFSIVCKRSEAALRFAYTHSSTPRGGDGAPRRVWAES